MTTVFKNLRIAATALLGCAFVFASCQKQPEVVDVQSVALDETSIILFPGDAHTFVATVSPSTATNKAVSWTSSAPTVVSVTKDGVATALEVGRATITVKTDDGGKTASCEVEVMAKRVSVTGVKLNKNSTTIFRGSSETLTATVEPENATVKDVTWTSSNPEVATVEDGVVSALTLGTTTITVTTRDGEKTATCEVTVDANTFTVSFQTNGAGEIAPAEVTKNEKVAKPADPVKEGGIDPGLYAGLVDPDSGSSVFDGWYSDPELTVVYDFDTPVTADFTLYAKWDSSDAPIVRDSDEEPFKLKDAIEWLNENGEAGKDYTLVITKNTDSTPPSAAFSADVTLYVLGQKEERTLELKYGQTLLKSAKNEEGQDSHPAIVFGKNITITGRQELIRIEEYATVTLLEGAKITGCEGSRLLGFVYVNSNTGYFILKGGVVENNTLTSRIDGFNRAAIINAENGCVKIESGRIANNTVTAELEAGETAPSNPFLVAGAVLCYAASWNGNAFSMTGGEIKGNKAELKLPDGVSGYKGEQVLATFRNDYKPIYAVNDDIAEGTSFKFNSWGNPWVCIREN